MRGLPACDKKKQKKNCNKNVAKKNSQKNVTQVLLIKKPVRVIFIESNTKDILQSMRKNQSSASLHCPDGWAYPGAAWGETNRRSLPGVYLVKLAEPGS